MNHRDQLYDEKVKLISDFNFGAQTATVFDDMLDRSLLWRDPENDLGSRLGLRRAGNSPL